MNFINRLKLKIALKHLGLARKFISKKDLLEVQDFLMEASGLVTEEYLKTGKKAYSKVEQIGYKLGQKTGQKLKDKFGFGHTLQDAADMLYLMTFSLGIEMRYDVSTQDIREKKLSCPMYDKNKAFCEPFCIAATRGMVQVLDPNFEVELTKKPADGKYCRKRIYYKDNPKPL